MSLNVHNAFRYVLADQASVHKHLMSRCVELTKSRVDSYADTLDRKLTTVDSSRWFEILTGTMHPSMPSTSRVEKAVSWAVRQNDSNRFSREYLHEYHRFVRANLVPNPIFDTVLTWTYMWDFDCGYLTLFLPLGVDSDTFVEGISALEPFSYFGGTCETDSISTSADDVEDTWERILGNSSPSFHGATAALEGFELYQAFGLI